MFIRFDMIHEREKNRRFHVPQPTFLFPLGTPLDPEQLKSYRPVSNLSYISKIVERVVAERLTAHVNASNLFPVISRHIARVTVLKLHFCRSTMVCSIDDGKVSVLVLLDLSSAFDTVDHEILLSLLTHRFCVRDTAYDWCRSYLSSRIQSFNFADQQTGPYPVECSVPQGSVLGPLKFIAYTENGVNVIKHHNVNVHLYADDTQLYDCCYPHNIAKTRQRMSHCTADFFCVVCVSSIATEC